MLFERIHIVSFAQIREYQVLNILTRNRISRFSLPLLLAASVAMLSACGGGGAAAGTAAAAAAAAAAANAAAVATAPTLTIALTTAAGAATTSISTAAHATVKATLKDAAGAAVANTVVTFTTDATLATMNPAAGTALTNAAGVASITLSPLNLTSAGAASITATAQVAATAVTGSLGYSIGTSAVTISTPAFGVGVAQLSAFGTTSVSVTVSSGGVPVTTPQTVIFSSGCSSSGKAVLGSVVTVNGLATGSYRDNGCAGTDTVTASVSGGLASSSATLTVAAPTTGSIQYVSATPLNISLKGSGGAPTSQVIFKVLDTGGNPISGKTVTLGLSTTVGGLSLASYSGISDAAGQVIATVNSGTVSTPVRVTASTPGVTAGSTLTTQSSQLSITTGIPDQTSFSLSATQHNIEGMNYDGVTTVLTARLADHFKNPAPDGTTVNFTSEAGSVVGTCNTVAGACSATLTTQGIRPATGRITVLAYAIGEESFIDFNANGVADLVTIAGNEMVDINNVSTDLPEAFVDYNEDGIRQGTEPFIDFNADGIYTPGDLKYSGVLCDNVTAPPVGSSAGTCATSKTLHVRSSQVIVFSGSTAAISVAPIVLPQCIPAVGGGAPSTFNVTVLDVNGNAMPVGSTVNFTTTNGIITSGNYIVPDTIGCLSAAAGCPASAASATFGNIPVTMKSDAVWAAGVPNNTCTNSASSGVFTVTVTTPKGLITTATTTVAD